jgi:uncharacterized SAM-binding protein YcdF (DUF218 family)
MDNLFFIASKLFWMLARPDSWPLFAAIGAWAALQAARPALALRLVAGMAVFQLVFAVVPLGNLMILPLERHIARLPDADEPDVIIVLGGAEQAEDTVAAGSPQVNEAGDRLLEALALARRHPRAPVLITGGSGRLQGSPLGSAEIAARAFIAAGVDPGRIIEENDSRNTAENATMSALAFTSRTGIAHGSARVALVTSAFHMPRSLGAFCAAGWRAIAPHPTDYRAGTPLWQANWNYGPHVMTFATALREWIGLAAYRLTGRTTNLLPERC